MADALFFSKSSKPVSTRVGNPKNSHGNRTTLHQGARPFAPRRFLDACGGALSHQRPVLNGRQDQLELCDDALSVLHSRYPIDVADTLQAFDTRFATGDIFRSASQICEMFLYPASWGTWKFDPLPAGTGLVAYDSASANIKSWWYDNTNGQLLTADNAREEPYDQIYSRITTKSNDYTVHWRVQVLRKAPGSTATVWNENTDTVASELRGSTLIERYIDPNATLPDYATGLQAGNLRPMTWYYKWRTVSENYFHP
jgi:hypothetical protein